MSKLEHGGANPGLVTQNIVEGIVLVRPQAITRPLFALYSENKKSSSGPSRRRGTTSLGGAGSGRIFFPIWNAWHWHI